MTETQRLIFLRLGWFSSAVRWVEQDVRPLTFGTWNAMQVMGLTLLERDVELTLESEYQQILAYMWLHRESPETISEGLWDGSWRRMLEMPVPRMESQRALFESWREYRQRVVSLLEASEITVKPRPPAKNDDTPMEVVGPDEIARMLAVVQRATRNPVEHLLWEMPLWQFRQHYHSEMRWQGHWTIRPAGKTVLVDFEGFGESVMANLQEQSEESEEQEEEEANE